MPLTRSVRAVWLLPALAGCSLSLSYDLGVEQCDDGTDNDLDGATDCEDPDCDGARFCEERLYCGDGRDNDLNGLVDGDDYACWGLDDTTARRLTYRRCGRVDGTLLGPEVRRGDWTGDVDAPDAGGIRGPLVGEALDATLDVPLTGARRGTVVRATLGMAPEASSTTLGLRAWPTTPPSRAPEVSVGLERDAEEILLVLDSESRLSARIGRSSRTGRTRVEVELTLDAELRGIDCGGSDTSARCTGLRATAQREGGVPVALVLPREPRSEAFIEAPPLRLAWTGESAPGGLELKALEVVRDPYLPCDVEVPHPGIEVFQEVHAVTGDARDDPARREALCMSGRGRDGGVWTARAIPPEELVPGGETALTFTVPAWADAVPADGHADLSTVTLGFQEDRPSYVLLTQASDADALPSVWTSADCASWERSSALTLGEQVEPADRSLRPLGELGPLRLLGSGVDSDGRVRVVLGADGQRAVLCVLDPRTGACDRYEDQPGQGVTRRNELPLVTALFVGDNLVVLDGFQAPGALIFQRFGVGLDRVPFLEGSTDPGAFDAEVIQGAVWLAPPTDIPVSLQLAQNRYGWLVYSARATPGADPRVGTARLELRTERRGRR